MKKSHTFESFSFYALLLFYLLVALDFQRIPFSEGNHPRALADLIVLSGIFLYFYITFNESQGVRRKIFLALTAFLVRLIAYTGRGVFLRGEVFLPAGIFELWLLFIMCALNDWRSFLLFSFHPLAFAFAGGKGSLYTVSIELFFVAKNLFQKEGKWRLAGRALELSGGLSSLGGSIIFFKRALERKNYVPEVPFFLLMAGVVYFFLPGHFLISDITHWFRGSPCASSLNVLKGSGEMFIRILAFISVVASAFQKKVYSALFFFLLFHPVPISGAGVFSLYGWACEKKFSLKFYSLAFLLVVYAGEWSQKMCFLPFPVFAVLYGGFAFLYLREVLSEKS